MHKPRFNRSAPRVVKAANLKQQQPKGTQGSHGRLSQTKANVWKPVSIDTLGYLAATNKIGLLQVHQRIDYAGAHGLKKFRDAFFDSVNLKKPTEQDIRQINLFSHLLFN